MPVSRVLPSRTGRFGLVYLKAKRLMAAEEIVEDEAAGRLVDLGDIGQLVKALLRLWSDAGIISRFGEVARERWAGALPFDVWREGLASQARATAGPGQ